jgi:hypothetical protein
VKSSPALSAKQELTTAVAERIRVESEPEAERSGIREAAETAVVESN